MSTRRRSTSAALPVYLEEGTQRVFAVAVDWPGWARPGRNAEAALAALARYRDRYADAVGAAGFELPAPDADPAVQVVARIPGNATTDFGAPGVVPDLDRVPWTTADADRQARLVAACWARLDDVAAGAPAELRKGPRGGGRDRDAIVAHVLDAEHAYRRKAGLKLPAPKDRAGTDALREQFLDLLRSAGALDEGTVEGSGWPLPYTARRTAWHALDHAWEIEDRST